MTIGEDGTPPRSASRAVDVVGRVVVGVGVLAAVAFVSSTPTDGLGSLAIGIALYAGCACGLRWLQARRRPVPAGPLRGRGWRWACLAGGVMLLVGATLLATTTVRPDSLTFGSPGRTCGSVLIPRDFSEADPIAELLTVSSAVDCEYAVQKRTNDVLAFGQLGVILSAVALVRRSAGHPGRTRLLRAPLRFAFALVVVLGALGAVVALDTRRTLQRAENIRPVEAARPVAIETCTALTAWRGTIVEASRVYGLAAETASDLRAQRAAVVQLVGGVRTTTNDLVTRLERIVEEHGDVSGVPELVGLLAAQLETASTQLDHLVRQSEALAVDTQEEFDAGKASVSDGITSAGAEVQLGDIAASGSPAIAGVMATFQAQPECAAIF